MTPPRPTPVLSDRQGVVLLGLVERQTSIQLSALFPAALSDSFAFDGLLPYDGATRQVLREAGQMHRFNPRFWYVLVGTEVIRALGKRALPARRNLCPLYLEWYESSVLGVTMAMLPSPSVRNHWYDAPDNRRKASRFLRAAASPPGSRVDQRFRQALARRGGGS